MSYYDDASLVLIPSGVKTSKVYSQKPTNGTGDFTFSRASTATRTNSSGVNESVASNVPRLDYMTASGTLATCPMLEVEGQRTNSIRNSSMVGAVAGTPGTLPTNWLNLVTAGLTLTIVETGTENGLPYVDIRFNGTANALSTRIDFEGSTNIAALTAQVWTNSIYSKIVSQPNPAVSYALQMLERTSGGGFVDGGSQIFTPTNSLQRFAFTRTLNGGATVANVQPCITMNLTNGATYDFTIRIAAPQMELGAYATTWVPTTTATVTRLRDDVAISGASALIGQTEGTIFLDVDFRVVSGGGIRVFFNIEGSVTNQFTGVAVGTTNDGNNVQGAGTTYTLTQGRHKIIYRYNSATNVSKLFVDGAQRGASTFAAFSATIDRIAVLGRINPFISAFVVDRQQFGGCNQFAVWKTALTDAQCIQLSTL